MSLYLGPVLSDCQIDNCICVARHSVIQVRSSLLCPGVSCRYRVGLAIEKEAPGPSTGKYKAEFGWTVVSKR